jgi:hypothetical protein
LATPSTRGRRDADPARADMRRHIVVAWLAAVAAGCTPVPHRDLAVQPSEIAAAMCLQYRPGDETACTRLRLANPTSALAYGMCREYHKLDVKACNDLRMAYEAELRAYLELSNRFQPRPPFRFQSRPL